MFWPPIDKPDQLLAQVAGVMKSAKLPKLNIIKKEQQALVELRKEKSIMILPTDKGKATVIMDTGEYEQKVITMLSDDKTWEIEKDPTPKYKRKLVSIIKKLKEEDKITDEQYKYLYPTEENVPRMYCTPKIHKPDNPLRPIVDYTGCIGYNVSRSLVDLLAPIDNPQYHKLKALSYWNGMCDDRTRWNVPVTWCSVSVHQHPNWWHITHHQETTGGGLNTKVKDKVTGGGHYGVVAVCRHNNIIQLQGHYLPT